MFLPRTFDLSSPRFLARQCCQVWVLYCGVRFKFILEVAGYSPDVCATNASVGMSYQSSRYGRLKSAQLDMTKDYFPLHG